MHGGERIVRYLLSDSSVARDGHTIATSGWVLDSYLKNPIVQWAHALDEPPIGRMVELGVIGDRLMGSIEYPDAETYPFADTIFRLVKGGYINAVSVSWNPLSWKFSTDRERPGGIDFLRAELLEVSNVPLPAAPAALATARAAGIDTGPLYAWAEKVLDGGDRILIPRAELEEMRRAAKMPRPQRQPLELPSRDEIRQREGLPPPIERAEKPKGDYGDVKYADPGYQEDGKPRYPIDTVERIKAAWNYINVESNASQYSAAEVAKIKGRIIAAWKEKIDPKGPPSARAFAALQRDLCACSWLAMIVGELACLEDCAEMEAEIEGDDSPIPDRLSAVLRTLGQILVDMTVEEVGELLAAEDMEDHGTPAQRALRGLGRAIAVEPPPQPTEAPIVRIGSDAARIVSAALDRAGRVLSAESEADVRASIDHLTRAGETLRSLLERATPAPEPIEIEEPDPLEMGLARARESLAKLRQEAAD